MKVFLAVLVVLSMLCHQVPAKAYFQTKDEMIKRAEVIAIISITAVRDSDAKGRTWTYQKSGEAKVEAVLKGDISKAFTLYGAENFICASCPIREGRFVAFLRKDGDFWTGSNWQFSLRPIEEANVSWYADDATRYEMKPTVLNAVISQIKHALESEAATSAVPRVVPHSE